MELKPLRGLAVGRLIDINLMQSLCHSPRLLAFAFFLLFSSGMPFNLDEGPVGQPEFCVLGR